MAQGLVGLDRLPPRAAVCPGNMLVSPMMEAGDTPEDDDEALGPFTISLPRVALGALQHLRRHRRRAAGRLS